jgi:lipopolysaccharide transport system permease protein
MAEVNKTQGEINQAGEDWDLIIESNRSILSIDFKSLWHYRDLLFLLVKRDITSFYKQTILGPLWFFLQPLITTLTFTVIFGNLAALSTDGLPQPLFYMTGIIAWNYFNDCLVGTGNVFRNNAGIFGKVYFPRLVMPLALVFSNLVKFGVQLLLLVILLLVYAFGFNFTAPIGLQLLLIPFFILLMALLGLAGGMIVSSMTTKYRDLSFLVGFGMSLFMYATPVIYPISTAPEKYRWILELNPLASIIEGFRWAILGTGEFTFSGIAYTVMVAVVLFIVGLLAFNKVEKNFIDTV